jgi:hypothetical protein
MDANQCLCEKDCSIKDSGMVHLFRRDTYYNVEQTILGFRIINGNRKVFLGKDLFKRYFIDSSDHRERQINKLIENL